MWVVVGVAAAMCAAAAAIVAVGLRRRQGVAAVVPAQRSEAIYSVGDVASAKPAKPAKIYAVGDVAAFDEVRASNYSSAPLQQEEQRYSHPSALQ